MTDELVNVPFSRGVFWHKTLGTIPRTKVCWECGGYLKKDMHTLKWHFIEAVVDEHPRILHKMCHKEFYKDCEIVVSQ